MASGRFYGKPLVKILGKPLVIHVLDYVKRFSEALPGVEYYCLTDSAEIEDIVFEYGHEAVRSPSHLKNGTERLAYFSEGRQADIYINIQADEPALPDGLLLSLASSFSLYNDGHPDDCPLMGTVVVPSSDPILYNDRNTVKALVDTKSDAVYFSRSPIPHHRDGSTAFFYHLGLYAYNRAALLFYRDTPASSYEVSESLEQLRAIENGVKIHCLVADLPILPHSINTPEDVGIVENLLNKVRAPKANS
jgi:3-deoxy-manno-octulosonate cytidylyltransferase (CMP-KDO synthetase)